MDGNREPDVVQEAESGATVADVARLLGTVRLCYADDRGSGLIGHAGAPSRLAGGVEAVHARSRDNEA
jgi:hypothetical protein